MVGTTVCDASDLKQQTAKTNVNQLINIYLSPCNIQPESPAVADKPARRGVM